LLRQERDLLGSALVLCEQLGPHVEIKLKQPGDLFRQ
jgi:hypothetical protein